MKLAAVFAVWMVIVCLLSALWIKALPSAYGLVPFIGTLALGILVGVSVLGSWDEGKIQSLTDLKRATVDGGSLFVSWATYMLGAALLGAVAFFFLSIAPPL